MSTHSVNIVEIAEILPHPNADRMEIVKVGGWSACVGKGQFKIGDRAVYVEPDYVVPLSRSEFAFLEKINPYEGKVEHRMRTARLRGVVSFGLLIRVPDDLAHLPTGTNVMEELGIRRYVPAASSPNAMASENWPAIYDHHFDVEQVQNFESELVPGEDVIVTEKVDGANARFLWHDGRLFMGSRKEWLESDKVHDWSRVAATYPQIEEFCRAHPDTTLYGEIYGTVQKLKYGLTGKHFVAFAALTKDQWWDTPTLYGALARFNVPVVPVLYVGPYDRAKIAELAELDSKVAVVSGHLMEGVVVAPMRERHSPNLGRVALKLISNRYWES